MFDCCVNLLHSSFDKDRSALLQRAIDAGLEGALLCSADMESSTRTAALAQKLSEQYPVNFYATAGVHPHQASSWQTKTPLALRTLVRKYPGVKALGEMGLDYARNLSPPEQQRAVFKAQLDLAVDLGLAVFLHQRDSHKDFLQILTSRARQLPAMLVHCFTGSSHELNSYLDLGCYIGITGWFCDERRGTHLPHLIATIPPDKLLVETDSPYLIPRNLPAAQRKNNRNEPAYLRHLIHEIAGHLSMDAQDLALVTRTNAARFLQINVSAAA